MTNKEARKAWEKLYSEIDKDNWLFVGTINPEMVALAIKALEEKSQGEWKDHRWCSNCGCGIPTDVYGTSITEEEAHFCVECGADMRVKEAANYGNEQGSD